MPTPILNNISSRCNTRTTKALCIIHISQNKEVGTHYMCRYMYIYKASAKKEGTWQSSLLCLGMLCMQNLQGLWLGTTNGCGQSCMIHTLSYHSKYQTYMYMYVADHMHSIPINKCTFYIPLSLSLLPDSPIFSMWWKRWGGGGLGMRLPLPQFPFIKFMEGVAYTQIMLPYAGCT